MTSSFYDVIKLLKFCSFSALILLLNFNGVLKTGKYVEVKPLSFQKLKKEFKNLFLFVFKSNFNDRYFLPFSAAGVLFVMTSSLF